MALLNLQRDPRADEEIESEVMHPAGQCGPMVGEQQLHMRQAVKTAGGLQKEENDQGRVESSESQWPNPARPQFHPAFALEQGSRRKEYPSGQSCDIGHAENLIRRHAFLHLDSENMCALLSFQFQYIFLHCKDTLTRLSPPCDKTLSSW